MSTRSFVGLQSDGEVGEIRYIHWDGYPQGVGKTLWDWCKQIGPERVLDLLLYTETGGWSVVAGTRPDVEPRNMREMAITERYDGPTYYPVTEGRITKIEEAASVGCEWGYLINPKTRTFSVLSSMWQDTKMIGAFGMGMPDARWVTVGVFELDGPEPDWVEVTRRGFGTEDDDGV